MLASDQAPGWRDIPFAKGHPKMSTAWLTVGPEALYWAPKLVQSLWNAKEIFITENGCVTDDVLADDGKVYDTDRIMFLRACLTQLQRATADGVPVKGYFQWSTMDNFEWTYGFGNRFGLVYVDFKTQKRTPKLSAAWFREAAASATRWSSPLFLASLTNEHAQVSRRGLTRSHHRKLSSRFVRLIRH